MHRSYMCVAKGRENDWEAICLDLDIAVQGESFDEVRATLLSALRTYIQDAEAEAPHVRDQLLNRRAPWHVRLKVGVMLFLSSIMDGRNDGDHQFEAHRLSCPA